MKEKDRERGKERDQERDKGRGKTAEREREKRARARETHKHAHGRRRRRRPHTHTHHTQARTRSHNEREREREREKEDSSRSQEDGNDPAHYEPETPIWAQQVSPSGTVLVQSLSLSLSHSHLSSSPPISRHWLCLTVFPAWQSHQGFCRMIATPGRADSWRPPGSRRLTAITISSIPPMSMVRIFTLLSFSSLIPSDTPDYAIGVARSQHILGTTTDIFFSTANTLALYSRPLREESR